MKKIKYILNLKIIKCIGNKNNFNKFIIINKAFKNNAFFGIINMVNFYAN